MAEDKKTKQELEVQAKIANDFKLARNEADKALKASYSAEIQALLVECSKYNGVTQLTEVGKRLDKHLAKSGSLPSEFFRKELKQMQDGYRSIWSRISVARSIALRNGRRASLITEERCESTLPGIYGALFPHHEHVS